MTKKVIEKIKDEQELAAFELMKQLASLLDLLDCEVNDDDGGKGNRYM